MSHNGNCTKFREALDKFIAIRSAQFLERSELAILLSLAPPCHECAPNTNDLSPLSGRLYKQVWDRTHKVGEGSTSKAQDMFPHHVES